jgi:NAD(P)H-dependent FMN reductase
MTNLVGIAGSLRSGSFNLALLRAAAAAAPEGVRLEVHTLHGIPLYDGDVEREHGLPEAAERLKRAVAGADGVIVATPEYNNSMPGVLKNAIDWMTRPPADIARVFRDRPLAVMGATPGGFGTVLAQNAWLSVWRPLGVRLWTGGRVTVARAGQRFDESGALTDDELRGQLAEFVSGFARFAKGG